MCKNIKTVISEFQALDLKEYPKDQILALFQEVGRLAYVGLSLQPGKLLMRARPNKAGERFETRDDYSFKPAKSNDTYQRASTPDQTMFYAAAIPNNVEAGEISNMRIIGVLETMPILRDKTKSWYQKISFGKWRVKEDLNLVAIVHKDLYSKASHFTKDLEDGYQEFIKSVNKELREDSLEFVTFLAEEFAKSEINHDYEYMISAIFSELAIKQGCDGIFYPSVRADGKGFNVALKPEAVSKLELIVAGECSLYKSKDHTVVGNDAVVELNGDETHFKLKELPSSEEFCLKRLGVESIDALVGA